VSHPVVPHLVQPEGHNFLSNPGSVHISSYELPPQDSVDVVVELCVVLEMRPRVSFAMDDKWTVPNRGAIRMGPP